MTTTPNYGALLQSFWTPPTTSIAENSDSTRDRPSEPIDIIEFLGEDLLWQQTIPAQEPDLKEIPADLPPELVEALHAQGIHQL
jgi:DEAD/DEAH box helicase domain-containing protein